MKSVFALDPSRDYGDATPAIRQIVSEWTAVDWFVPAKEVQAAPSLGDHPKPAIQDRLKTGHTR
jgi:hypothetical protein